MTDLPYRLSEACFRQYETEIAEIVQLYPEPVVFNPEKKGLRATTFTARLRDSFISLSQFKWPTAKVDMPKFLCIADHVVIRHQSDGTVLADNDNTFVLKKRTLPSNVIRFESEDQMRIVCQRVAEGGPPVVVAELPSAIATSLEANFDIRVDENLGGKTHTIS